MCSPSDISTETLNLLSEYVDKNLKDDPKILIKIAHASWRIGRLNERWFRLGESAVSSLLRRPYCEELNLDDLVCLGDFIVMANSSDDHVKAWIRSACPTLQPPPVMEDTLSELKAKKNRIRMYCEYPDGTHRLASDQQMKKAAFCGIFLTITLGLSDGLISFLGKKKF